MAVVKNIDTYGQTFEFWCGGAYRAGDCWLDDADDEYVAPSDFAFRTVTYDVLSDFDDGWMEFAAWPYYMNVYTDARWRPAGRTNSTTYGGYSLLDGTWACGTYTPIE